MEAVRERAIGGVGAAPSLMRFGESSLWGGRYSALNRACLPFAPLQGCRRLAKEGAVGVVAMAGKKKVNAYDEKWKKQWFGAGFFAESKENEQVNFIKKLEKKKLLTQVEKAGILSKAESAGLSLSTIEKLGLLTKAEDLGLLSLAENFATSSPAVLASYALPLFVASIATIVIVPDSSPALVIGQNVVAALFLAGSVGLFVGSIILSGLQEE